MIKQLIWKLMWKIKNLYCQFGGPKTNAGFVMPTVFAFIIISSSVILYQSLSLVNQIYSVKSAIKDLNTIETVINTTRIVDEIDSANSCKNLPKLSYGIKTENQYQISFNCILINSNHQSYNSYTQSLFTNEQVSKSLYEEQLTSLFNASVDLVQEKSAKVTFENETFEMTYEQLMYMAVIKYGAEDIRILIIGENKQVDRNIYVKKM